MRETSKQVHFYDTAITGGFWQQKQQLIREVSIGNVYKRFAETGRFAAFRCDWKEGMPDQPHIFWDSDIAKWIESVAFLCEEKRESELEKIVDEVVDEIEKNQCEDGYFNIYFMVCEPQARFTRRTDHELYCAGHLMEAAVAYAHATGKDKFLRLMCRYADLIDRVFRIEHSAKFSTPGHEEIELALVKLYHATGEKRYLELSEYFINTRGTIKEECYDWADACYNQSHLPVREQTTAEGHSVRAAYLYSAMADIARETNDKALFEACRAIYDNITSKRMYVTGGIGSSAHGEMFTVDYDLPNKAAYTESCAAIALAMFCRRMSELDCDSAYADTVERIIYNGFLSSVSLDGKSFFYENPLEIDLALHARNDKIKNGHFPPAHRFEVFGCSCCPPNITRFIASIGDYLYTSSGDTVYVNQYMDSDSAFATQSDKAHIIQRTNYPYDGIVNIKNASEHAQSVALRIPAWCDGYTVSGAAISRVERGYAFIELAPGASIVLDMKMDVYLVTADPNVQNDCGRAAIFRGPMLFCAEAKDNGEDLHAITVSHDADFAIGHDDTLDVMTLSCRAARADADKSGALYTKFTRREHDVLLKLIPYYAFANRGDSDMLVWFNVR